MNAYCTVQQMLSIYDARVMKQLSGDQNSLAGVLPNIQFHLDMNASELDSHFYGRVELPMSAPGIPATGTISYVSVPADGSTNTISDGSTTVVFTYLSGGVATNQINTASGLVNTIAGLLARPLKEEGMNG
jgi:hypothetical protein